MDKVSIIIFIVQIICGIGCIGVGIYYMVSGADVVTSVIFLIVGAVCMGMAARTFISARKERGEDGKDDDGKDGDK